MLIWTPQHTPSYKQGFARNAAESENPGLWKGLAGAWFPSLGPTGATLRDISGRKNHGTLTDMDPATDWVVTEKGSVLEFDGATEKIVCGKQILTSNENQFSLSLWAKRVGSNYGGMISKDKSIGEAREWFLAEQGNDEIYLRLYQSNGTGRAYTTTGDKFPVGVWTHIAVVIDGVSTKVWMYVNGHAIDATPGSWDGTCKNTSSTNLRLAQTYNDSYCYDGQIANAGIWNRALSPNEIQHLYEDPHALVRPRARWFPAATAAPATTTSLISYKPQHTPTWKQGFARNAAESDNPGLWKGLAGAWMPSLGPTGLTIRDISGRKNHGTLTNMDPATDWVMTEKGYALDFDGTNDYVVGTPMSMLTGSQLTVSAWLYCRSDTEDQRAISRGGYSGPVILLWGDNQSGGGVQGLGNTDIYMFTSYLGSSNRVNGTTNSRIINTWQHVVGVMNGAYRGLYVDGSLNASHSSGVQQTLAVTADNLWFGDWQAASLPANMRLGPVSIHNRVLSPNEIQHLYQDPHALVRPRARWFPAAAAAPGGLSIPIAMHHYQQMAGAN